MKRLLLRASPTAWVTFQTIAQQLFSVLIFAIQAPMLGPHPFGLISVVMVLVGFCEFVLGSAAAEALISIKDIEDLHFHTMTLVTLLLALFASCALLIGANTLGALFGDVELPDVLRVMSVLPLISALSAAPTASTKRSMLFRATAVRAIAGVLCGGLVGLALTLAGFGVWALVWQAIVQRLVATTVLWLVVPLRFRLRWSSRHFVELRRFASVVIISRTMNWASAQLPRFLLGLFLGTTELGYYSLAARLTDILSQLTLEPKVTVARIELRRFAGDPAGLENATVHLFTYLSALCFPLFIGGAAIMPLLFHAWLDVRWTGGIVPAQWLLLMGVPSVTMYCTTAILMAANKQTLELVMATVQTISVALAVLFVAPFGLIVTTAVMAGLPLVLMPLPLAALRRGCGIATIPLLHAQARALLASLLMGLAVWLLGSILRPYIATLSLLVMLVFIGALGYAALLYVLLRDFCVGIAATFFPRGTSS